MAQVSWHKPHQHKTELLVFTALWLEKWMLRRELKMSPSLLLCTEALSCTHLLRPDNEACIISLYIHCFPSYILRKTCFKYFKHFFFCFKLIQLSCSASSSIDSPSIKYLYMVFFFYGFTIPC